LYSLGIFPKICQLRNFSRLPFQLEMCVPHEKNGPSTKICFILFYFILIEGRCTCDYAERELNYIVFENKSKEVSWNKPRSITCPHKFLLRRKVEPNVTSPHNFSVGLHNVKYIFELYGRRNITCDIDVSIRYCVSSKSHFKPVIIFGLFLPHATRDRLY
jgi:hypothetical protein